MSTEIVVTPERLREISTQMSAGTAEIDVILHRIAGDVASVRAEWVGPARTQFETLWEQLQGDANGLHSVLTGIAKLTQNAATAYEAAEKAIAESFTEFRAEIEEGPEQWNQGRPTPTTRAESPAAPKVDDALLVDNGQPVDRESTDPRRPTRGFGKELALRAGRTT